MKTRRGTLNRFIAKQWCVKITRRGGLPTERGFPVAIGRTLAIVQVLDDFALKGYSMIPLEEITAVESEGGQSFQEIVFRKNGMMSRVGLP